MLPFFIALKNMVFLFALCWMMQFDRSGILLDRFAVLAWKIVTNVVMVRYVRTFSGLIVLHLIKRLNAFSFIT